MKNVCIKNLLMLISFMTIYSAAFAQSVATIYSDSDFKGNSWTLSPGEYYVNGFGIGNDVLSSIKILNNDYVVILHKDNELKGPRMDVFTSYEYIGDDFNDQISSIGVYKKSDRTNTKFTVICHEGEDLTGCDQVYMSFTLNDGSEISTRTILFGAHIKGGGDCKISKHDYFLSLPKNQSLSRLRVVEHDKHDPDDMLIDYSGENLRHLFYNGNKSNNGYQIFLQKNL